MTQDSILTNCIQPDELIPELGIKKDTYNKAVSNVDSNVENFYNFTFLKSENFQLAELGYLAEHYLESDPITSIMKTGQFAELLALQIVEKKHQIYTVVKNNMIRFVF